MTYDRELRTEAAHALTHNSEVWADRGYAVVTAGGLSAGSTDFELDVGPYDVLVGSTTQTSVGPTTLSVNAPDSDPYWLVVYVDSAGLQTTTGPEGEVFVGDQSVVASNADVREITSPAPPTLADIGPVTVLGKVLVTSSGVTNSLIDDRVFQSERVFDVVNARSASVDSLESEHHEYTELGENSQKTHWESIVSGNTRVGRQTRWTGGVGTSSQTIFVPREDQTEAYRGHRVFVQGGDGDGNRFAETISYIGFGSPNVTGTTTLNNPTGRAYSVDADRLELAMDGDEYDVIAVGLGVRHG